MNETFETVRKDGRLLYEYIRGSHLYNLNVEGSDIDSGGIYICDPSFIYEQGVTPYQFEIADTKHDTTWYELGKFMGMLVKSNPTVFESLFVPQNKVLTPRHKILEDLFAYKHEFITKDCFKPFIGYAIEQIKKARGLNKKFVCPIVERKTPLDFTYTFNKQGSIPIMDFLNAHHMKIQYCGLNNIPHMNDIYGLFYDWGKHYEDSKTDKHENYWVKNAWETLCSDRVQRYGSIKNEPILNYRGLVCEEISHTTQLRLSSIDDKKDIPICHISFNSNGFQEHCKKYKEYKDWEKNRNPLRYKSNLNKTYDSKNMMHCMRLMHMGREIAEGQGVNLERTWDREMLLKIRNHEYEYDELIEIVENEKQALDKAIASSTIREHINMDLVKCILSNARKQYYGSRNTVIPTFPKKF